MDVKKVSMFELFYDLIFVYAISQVTHTIAYLKDREISFPIYFLFVLICIMLMQSWMYQTTFINKYGKNSLSDYIGLFINMAGAIFVSISINTTWDKTFYLFNFGMLIMNCSLIYQFLLEKRRVTYNKTVYNELNSFLILLAISSLLSFLGLIVGYRYGIYLCVCAYLFQAYFPIFFKDKFLPQTLNFPHLIERNSLITIILFGEGIVSIAQLIKNEHIYFLAILFFLLIIILFAIYQYQIEKLMNHRLKNNGIMYMHIHILLTIGILTIISSFSYIAMIHVKDIYLNIGLLLLLQGLIIYYICLFSLTYYNRKEYSITKKDRYICSCIFLLGIACMLLVRTNLYLFMAIVLIMNLMVLVRKTTRTT